MNQQCKVCGEPAAGFHFGAFTCEGCKSFFGRTYNNLGSISECKNNGECVINKKNRTACKACRLRKCILVGMSKSGSRYGRRSNWFKIHCLLEEQSQAGKLGLQSGFFGNSHPLYPRSLYANPLMSPDKLLSFHGYPKKEEVRSESGESSSPGEHDDETRSTLSFFRPPSSHTTPSPKQISPFPSNVCFPHPASPVGSSSPYSPPVTSTGIFFPPHLSPNRFLYPPLATKPGITPANPLLTSWPPPGLTAGGDLLLCSPALAGVAVEQEHPIDLSVKTAIQYNTPPTPLSNSDHSHECSSDDDELSIDVERCSDGVSIKNNPLDLTAKRMEVPQSS